MRSNHFVIFFLFNILILNAHANDHKFYSINAKLGVSIREVNTVCKDDVGFVWASSKTGILRLTEDEYRTYQLPYNNANVVSVNLVYKDNRLIAYTNNGQVFKYSYIKDQFDLLVDLRNKINQNFISINSILVEDLQTLWIATSNGLYKYHSNQIDLIGFENSVVHKVIWINETDIVFCTPVGLFQINVNNHNIENLYKYNSANKIAVSELYFDVVQDKIWIGSLSQGVYYFDMKDRSINHFALSSLPKQPILAIEQIRDSTLLIGIDGQGLWEIDKNQGKICNIYKEDVDDINSLKGNGVYDIFCEPNERVWVATYSGGLSYFEMTSPYVTQIAHQTNNQNSLANNDVNCVIEDVEGKIWFATNNGISCWNVSENTWFHRYVNKQEQAQVFLTLCEDEQGQIWAGTYASGVYLLNGTSGEQLAHYSKFEPNSPFTNEFVFDITKDSNGDIWIGGINSEVIRYHSKENRFQKYSVQPLNVLAQYNNDQMLFGCTYGLSLSDNKTGESRIIFDGCLIQDIYVTDSIIWLATSGDGLVSYRPQTNTTQKYTTKNGLPSNFANSVTSENGFIWIGTENGLCRFNPIQETAVAYSSIPLLSQNSFNRNAHYKLKNGQLIWGTNNGAVIFTPGSIQETHKKGKIYIQNLSVSGRSIRELKNLKLEKPIDDLNGITLKHSQNTIAFELLPIGVASGTKFSWRLNELSESWSEPSSLGLINFANIPSKDYNLEIRLFDNSLSNILGERSFKVIITPPFYATPWFLLILFVIVSAIIYFSFWYYINILKQKHTEEKVRFFANTAHDLRTALTLIKAPIEELTKEKGLSNTGVYNINLANSHSLRLSTVVTQLMDFQKVDVGKGQLVLSMVNITSFLRHRVHMFESLAGKNNMSIEFSSNIKNYCSAIDETKMEKVVDNLISNAVKYGNKGSTVQIVFIGEDDKWTLQVTDKGIGIDKKAQRQLFKEFYRAENAVNSKIVGSGIGLLLVKNYIDLHNGKVSLTSQINEGSTFQISVPYKKVAETAKTHHQEEKEENPLMHLTGTENREISEANEKNEMKILLVEDNEDLLNFMKSNLYSEFEVYIAHDGMEAWSAIEKYHPDLVVSDILMPNKDGFELCQQIKSSFESSHIPVILLTALAGKAEQIHGLGLGADDYLTKPFDMTLLRQKIKTIITNRNQVRDKALKLIKGTGEEPVLKNELNDKFVKKMLDVVRDNMANTSFNKDDFAANMNVSSSLLYKKVKALTNQSPTDFIKSVRLDYAQELLLSKEYNVTEVSEMSGFSSIGYFSTVFKKHYGKSPTDI